MFTFVVKLVDPKAYIKNINKWAFLSLVCMYFILEKKNIKFEFFLMKTEM